MTQNTCQHCGAPAVKNQRFCGFCGAPAVESGSRKGRKGGNPQSRVRTSPVYPVLSGVLAVAAAILAVQINSNSQPPEQPHVHTEAPPVLSQNTDHLRALEQKLAQNPKDVETLIALGNEYYDIANDSEAIRYYRQALELTPDNVDVRVDMAISYYRQNDFDTALSEMQRAVEINPRHQTAWYNLGIVANQAGKHQEAVQYWKTYLTLAPDSPNAAQVQQFIEQWDNKK